MNERILRELRTHAAATATAARDRGDQDSAERWETLARLWDTETARALAYLFRTDWARLRDAPANVDPATAAAFARLEGGDDAA